MNKLPPNAALRDLAALLGEQATREIVQLFLKDFPESIRSLAGSGRDDQLRIAHGLKSSARHMGAERLTRRMTEIEDRLNRPGDPVTPEELAGAMSDFDAFATDLRRYAAG